MRTRVSITVAVVAVAASAIIATATELPLGASTELATLLADPEGLAAGDLDGDGLLDLVVTVPGHAYVSWLEGNGAGFEAPVWIDTGVQGVRRAQIADIDDDGDADVVLAASTADELYWIDNVAGDASAWTDRTVDGDGLSGAWDLAVADVNRDGDLDVVAIGASRLAWYESDGAAPPAFTEREITGLPATPGGVAVGDIDRDGDLDVVVAGDDVVSWWASDGGDPPTWTQTTIDAALLGAGRLALGDADGDGSLDVLAAAGGDTDELTWYLNTAGDGGTWAAQPVASGGPSATGFVHAIDVDQDGDLDAALAREGAGTVQWYENLDGAAATWTAHTVEAASSAPSGILVVDADADGDLDLVAADSHVNDGTLDLYGSDRIHGTSTFDTVTLINTADDNNSLRSADMDGDGDADLVATLEGVDLVVWWENDLGDASSWTEHQVCGPLSGGTCQDRPRELGLGDLDGDGDIDVVVSHFENPGATAWYRNEGGTWSDGGDIHFQAYGGQSADVADVDGDGDNDVIISDRASATVGWVENSDGLGGSWTYHPVASGFLQAQQLRHADMDGDGDVDLYGVAANTCKAAWFENVDGVGTSWTQRNVATLTTPSCTAESAAAADMDLDGDLDMVLVAGGTADVINWYENINGDGLTWGGHNISINDGGTVAVADFDQDGDPDVWQARGGEVYWYENLYGALGWDEHLIGGDNRKQVQAVDLDGDGDLDAVLMGDDHVTWRRNDLVRLDADASDLSLAEITEGTEEPLFELALEHRGNDSDLDLELAGLDLLIEDSVGPLATADTLGLIESISLWSDDGDGAFSDASDTLVLSVDQASLALAAGVQTFATVPGDPTAALTWDGGPGTFFVTVELAWDAWLRGISPLNITLVGDGVLVEPLGHDVAEPAGLLDVLATFDVDAVDVDGDGDPIHTDCDDADPAVFTGATELCDAIDSDCDGGIVDEFDDLDGDADPDCNDPDADGDGVSNVTDCDDLDPAVYPGASELCDAVDSDCDGSLADEYDDTDGDDDPDCSDDDDDGDGDPDTSDCATLDPTIYTAAPETCDAIDSDCDGSIVDEDPDFDGDLTPDCVDDDDDDDGDPDASDCDDLDAAVHTGASELCDAIDSDCDGSLVDEDPDFDGDLTPDCVDDDDDDDGDPDDVDCDDADATIYTGATETCDAIDSDCDGSIVDEDSDFDGDLTPDCVDLDDDDDGDPDVTDCDDGDATIYTGATEDCDDIDSDCDGSLEDGFEDTDGDGTPDCFDEDDDGDGMPDGFELTEGLDPLDPADAAGDSDLDGRANLQEYGDGTDLQVYDGPDAPVALQPVDTDVDSTVPELLVTNATSPVDDPLTYIFEVYADPELTDLLAAIDGVDQENVETDWVVNESLPDDASFYWRAAAEDAWVQGPWTDPAPVFVNTTDQDPTDGPLFVAPLDGAELISLSPTLVATEARDPEGEGLVYTFSVNTTEDFDVGEDLLSFDVVGDGSGQVLLSLAGQGVTLDQHITWYLQVEATDPTGGSSDADVIAVVVRGPNDPPPVPEVVSPAAGDTVPSPLAVEVGAVTDPEGDAVTYDLVAAEDEAMTLVVASVTGSEATSLSASVALAGPIYLSVRARDEDGATSDWSAPIALEVEQGHGCAAQSDGAEAALLLFLIGPLLLRTRRRERKGGPLPPWLVALPLLGACVLPPTSELYDGIEPSELPGDGTVEVDGDGDGVQLVEDCDDDDPTRYPGAIEICDGIDNDCDNLLPEGESDIDSDAWLACEGDCDDNDAGVHPDHWEQCDGIDEDCDGVVDQEPLDPCPCAQAIRPESGSSYLLCAGEAAWSDIPELCAVGYGPVSLLDEGERSFLVAAAGAEGLERPWIGLFDPLSDGSWQWADGATFDFADWATGQPSNGDCVALALPGPGGWITRDCSLEATFICEASP
jgi:hypothetical protein